MNKTDCEGRTALIAAAYMGHSDIVETLLEFKADIDHQDNDGRTALSVAALCVPISEGYTKVTVDQIPTKVKMLNVLKIGLQEDHQRAKDIA